MVESQNLWTTRNVRNDNQSIGLSLIVKTYLHRTSVPITYKQIHKKGQNEYVPVEILFHIKGLRWPIQNGYQCRNTFEMSSPYGIISGSKLMSPSISWA